jgi:hypothetical protein
MESTLITLITPTWDWLTSNQNATALGIILAGLANIIVLIMIARVIFFYHADQAESEGEGFGGKAMNPLFAPMSLAHGGST